MNYAKMKYTTRKTRIEIADYIAKKFFQEELRELPTPVRILIYGEVSKTIDKAIMLMKKHGKKKLEEIYNKNREVGNSSTEWNDEVG